MTDAPFPFDFVESATVTIQEVRVHERNGDAWTTVFTGSTTVDLVQLQGGVTQLLVDAAVPPGTYDQVRLIVEAGEVVLTDAAVVQGGSHVFNTSDGRLFFPSGAQTGIKIGIENDIVVTTQLSGDLLLDFDLAKNFVFNGPVMHAPGVKRVLFTPSVRATNVSVAGSLALRVLSDELTPLDATDDQPISGATVRVFDAGADPATDTPVATVATAADGTASVSLPPGTYDVVVEATGHEPATIPGAVIVLANLTNLGDVTLVATGQVDGVVMSDGGTPAPADTADDVVLAGVTVEVRPAGQATLAGTAITDSNGAFQVSGLAAGSYDLTFIAPPGFTNLVVPNVPASLTATGLPYLLPALTVQLQGLVTDSAAAPISGATVVITNAAGVQVASTATAADGTYSATLATGSYEVTFTNGGTVVVEPLTVVGATPPPVVVLNETL